MKQCKNLRVLIKFKNCLVTGKTNFTNQFYEVKNKLTFSVHCTINKPAMSFKDPLGHLNTHWHMSMAVYKW